MATESLGQLPEAKALAWPLPPDPLPQPVEVLAQLEEVATEMLGRLVAAETLVAAALARPPAEGSLSYSTMGFAP
ncbi:UNVERIFIED_CONTAM: hypothetical protein K2H54_060622 [Gekko kuhli]